MYKKIKLDPSIEQKKLEILSGVGVLLRELGCEKIENNEERLMMHFRVYLSKRLIEIAGSFVDYDFELIDNIPICENLDYDYQVLHSYDFKCSDGINMNPIYKSYIVRVGMVERHHPKNLEGFAWLKLFTLVAYYAEHDFSLSLMQKVVRAYHPQYTDADVKCAEGLYRIFVDNLLPEEKSKVFSSSYTEIPQRILDKREAERKRFSQV